MTSQEYLTRRLQRTPLTPAPEIADVQHGIVHYDPQYYSAHPRWGVYKNFGSGEIIVAFKMAPSAYESEADVSHEFVGGYQGKSVVLLKRTTDGGATWPAENNVVLYDETISDDAKRHLMSQRDVVREQYDMFSPDSVFWFALSMLYDENRLICLGFRSADRGRTWEKVPTVIDPAPGDASVRKLFSPVVRQPDGKTLLTVMNVPGGPALYQSTDQGVTWQFITRIAVDPTGVGRFTYDALLPLPSGELQCYVMHVSLDRDYTSIEGIKNAICMCSSTDGGKTWTHPVPIVGQGDGCWDFEAKVKAGESWMYRSPFPMLLQDGRILVVWARRRVPFGLGGVVSSDGGQTWSQEFVIRADDVSHDDIGYQIGSQLEDGRVFIAYYYNEAGKGYVDAVRYIAWSSFRI